MPTPSAMPVTVAKKNATATRYRLTPMCTSMVCLPMGSTKLRQKEASTCEAGGRNMDALVKRAASSHTTSMDKREMMV